MRVFLNGILSLIGSESLTDAEFATVQATTPDYDQATYDDLLAILSSRGVFPSTLERLSGYYVARGANFTPVAVVAKSNILIGSPL